MSAPNRQQEMLKSLGALHIKQRQIVDMEKKNGKTIASTKLKVDIIQATLKKQNKHIEYIVNDINEKNEAAEENENAEQFANAINLVGELYDNLDGLTSRDEWIVLGTALKLTASASTMFGGPCGMVVGAAIGLVSHIVLTERNKEINKGQFSEIVKAIKEHEKHNVEEQVKRLKRKWITLMNILEHQTSLEEEKNVQQYAMFGNDALADLATGIEKYFNTTDKDQMGKAVYYIWTYCLEKNRKTLLQKKFVSLLEGQAQEDCRKIFHNQLQINEDKRIFSFIEKYPKDLKAESGVERLYLFHKIHQQLSYSQIQLINQFLSTISDGKIKIYGQKGNLIHGHFDWSIRDISSEELSKEKHWKITDNKIAQSWIPRSILGGIGNGSIGIRVFPILDNVIGGIQAVCQNIHIEKRRPMNVSDMLYLQPFQPFDFLKIPKFKKGKPINDKSQFELIKFLEDKKKWVKFYGWKDGCAYGIETYDYKYDECAVWQVHDDKKDGNKICQIKNVTHDNIKFTFWGLRDKCEYFDKLLKPLRDEVDEWVEEEDYYELKWDKKWQDFKKYEDKIKYYWNFHHLGGLFLSFESFKLSELKRINGPKVHFESDDHNIFVQLMKFGWTMDEILDAMDYVTNPNDINAVHAYLQNKK
eukprot:53785_1